MIDPMYTYLDLAILGADTVIHRFRSGGCIDDVPESIRWESRPTRGYFHHRRCACTLTNIEI